MPPPHSIAHLNALPADEKFQRYAELIPPPLLQQLHLTPETLPSLLTIRGEPNTTNVEVDLRHAVGAPDPLFYGQFADSLNGQLLVLMTTINDPASPRFDTDGLPDGRPTDYGTSTRNVAAETAAVAAGLAPGQVRRGLRLFSEVMGAFEAFAQRLGHTMYFIEPLTYHNAILFERHGFTYQVGRRWMESIHIRFSPGGDAFLKLDGSTPFRQPAFAQSIRGRSWAIHDGILGEPYTGVQMYKYVGKQAGVNTTRGPLAW